MAMAAMAEAAAAAMEAEAGDQENLAQRLESAITARAEYIKDHAETLTMQSFRRLIEHDLGMENSALDPHKKKIKELVDRILNADDQTPQVNGCAIRAALIKRSSYLQKEKQNIDSQQIMRLLEEDMGLRKLSLDSEKDLVKPILDEFLSTLNDTKEEVPGPEVEAVETTTEESERPIKRKLESDKKPRHKRKLAKKLEESDESDSGDVEEDNDSKSKPVMRKALANQLEESDSEQLLEHKFENISKEKASKRKMRVEESEGEDSEKLDNVSKPKSGKKKPTKKLDEPDPDDSEELKPDAESPKKSSKKATKSDSKPVQSKLAEKLKKMIKACGMNVPPSLYKRVKDVPESSREKTLIKELESVLQKEGLDRNSSDKELKVVKRKKDKIKDLEGIDVGNIITQGRGRRQASNFYDLPLPVEKKKKIAIVSEDEDSDRDNPKTEI